MAPRPPRDIQKRLVDGWKLQVSENGDTANVTEALLELSACYLLGFGVEQNLNESLELLRKACLGNQVAKSIFSRVSQAMKSDGKALEDTTKTTIGTSFFSKRVITKSSRVIMTPNILE